MWCRSWPCPWTPGRTAPTRTPGRPCSEPATGLPGGPGTNWHCRASSMDRNGRCPRCGVMPSSRCEPDAGPPVPHPSAGAVAVGVRPVLIAYNVWITAPSDPGSRPDRALSAARSVATAVRGPGVRSLGLAAGQEAQVSHNFTDTEVRPGRGLRRGGRGRGGRRMLRAPCRTGRALSRRRAGWRPPPPVDPTRPQRGTDHRGAASASEKRADQGTVPHREGERSGSADGPALHGTLTAEPTPFVLATGPPQIPNFSPLARAYSRQSSLTHHTPPAHLLRLTGRRTPLREEQVRVDAPCSLPWSASFVLGARTSMTPCPLNGLPPTHPHGPATKPHSTDVTTDMSSFTIQRANARKFLRDAWTGACRQAVGTGLAPQARSDRRRTALTVRIVQSAGRRPGPENTTSARLPGQPTRHRRPSRPALLSRPGAPGCGALVLWARKSTRT